MLHADLKKFSLYSHSLGHHNLTAQTCHRKVGPGMICSGVFLLEEGSTKRQTDSIQKVDGKS